MKTNLLTLSLLVVCSLVYGQRPVPELIREEDGISKRFLTLSGEQQIAFNPLNVKTLLSLDAKSDLIIEKTESDHLGYTHYRYHQLYKGIPVENSTYIMHVKAG